ncbi:MAG: serine/threonine protein kinase [Pseudomonadota bacterium]
MSRPEFHTSIVLKRDIFSETHLGTLGSCDNEVIYRRTDRTPLYVRPIVKVLLAKEVRALEAVQNIRGVPRIIHKSDQGVIRTWLNGAPLHLVRPTTKDWYMDAKRLLREMRRANVAHNDCAKPQNWLVMEDGTAGLIDFQLATRHRKNARLFHVMAREDLRHLLKQKRRFAPHLLTPSERRLLKRKSLAARIWMATAKKAYNFVTRRLMNWTDAEGAGDRTQKSEAALRRVWTPEAGVEDFVICGYPMASKGYGQYAFVQSPKKVADLAALASEEAPNLIQGVARLPRKADGSIRVDVLQLIAENRLDEIRVVLEARPEEADVITKIFSDRLNTSDRQHKSKLGVKTV